MLLRSAYGVLGITHNTLLHAPGVPFQSTPALSVSQGAGSFPIDNGDGSENVTFKINSRFFQTLSRLFLFAENVHCRRISRELISWGPHSNLEKEIKIRRRLFASSIERKNRQFHIAVMQ